MDDKPRIDGDILPSPPEDPGQGSVGFRELLKRLIETDPSPTPREDTAHALAAIEALRDCAGWLSSESGLLHERLMEEAGLRNLTPQGYEDTPDFPVLRRMLNVGSFLTNMHLNYAQPQSGDGKGILRLEEQRLRRPTPDLSAAADVLRLGQQWLATATATAEDIRNHIHECYALYGVTSAAQMADPHPHKAVLRVAEEAEAILTKRLQPPREALDALAQNLPAVPGQTR